MMDIMGIEWPFPNYPLMKYDMMEAALLLKQASFFFIIEKDIYNVDD